MKFCGKIFYVVNVHKYLIMEIWRYTISTEFSSHIHNYVKPLIFICVCETLPFHIHAPNILPTSFILHVRGKTICVT